MKFTLEIELGGIVTHGADIATLLDQIAAAFDLQPRSPLACDKSPIRDGNGNTIGKWEVTESVKPGITPEAAQFFNDARSAFYDENQQRQRAVLNGDCEPAKTRKYRVYTGPTIVGDIAERLRTAGLTVEVEGTEHVYVYAGDSIAVLEALGRGRGFTMADIVPIGFYADAEPAKTQDVFDCPACGRHYEGQDATELREVQRRMGKCFDEGEDGCPGAAKTQANCGNCLSADHETHQCVAYYGRYRS